MANIFMNIKGYKPTQVATIIDPNGEVYMAVKSFTWGVSRNVSMDVGNVNNRDSGVGSVDLVTITKELDGSSDALLTSLFKFQNTIASGKDITFIFTKPKDNGQGNDIFYKVVLSDARMVSYEETLENNAKPQSQIAIAFNKIAVTFNVYDLTGKLTAGAPTIYNVSTNTLESGKFEKN